MNFRTFLLALLGSTFAMTGCGPGNKSPDGFPVTDEPPVRDGADAGDPDLQGPPATADDPPTTVAPVVTALVDKQNRPRGVAVDDTFVYFGSMGDSAIYKVAITGGAAQRVDTGASVTSPWVFAVDDTYVYFANSSASNDGSVARVAKAGGLPQTLVANVRPWNIAVDATNVYFTDQPLSGNGSIKRVAKSCALPCTATVMVPDQEFPMGIATDGAFVYWANMAAKVTYVYPGGPVSSREYQGTLRKWPSSSTTTDPAATTILDKLKDPAGVAVGGGTVFVATTADQSLHAIAPTGGSEIVVAKAGTAYSMGADEAYVYWLNGGATGKATLFRSAKGKNAAEVMASNQAGPVGLAVAKSGVYWANLDGGQIMRLAK